MDHTEHVRVKAKELTVLLFFLKNLIELLCLYYIG